MKMVKKRSGIVMKVTFFIMAIGIFVTIATIIFTNLYQNTFFADKKFEEISRNYYENTLYEDFIAEHNGEDLDEAFSKYTNGFNVKLRQILNSEFLKNNQNYRSFFETESYSCDTNTSTAKFIPHAPYGKKDYDIELNLNCAKN